MPRFNGESLQKPLLENWGKVHEKTSKWMWKPMTSFNNWLWDLPNAGLWFCGFCAILIPIYLGFLGVFLVCQAAIAALFATIGLILGILFIGVGIWPVFITAIIVTGITIITLPKNIYYHGLVTYR